MQGVGIQGFNPAMLATNAAKQANNAAKAGLVSGNEL